jgi:hypothetical protein
MKKVSFPGREEVVGDDDRRDRRQRHLRRLPLRRRLGDPVAAYDGIFRVIGA